MGCPDTLWLHSPDIKSGAKERWALVLGGGCGVGRLGIRLVPVKILLQNGQILMHLVHRHQGHLQGTAGVSHGVSGVICDGYRWKKEGKAGGSNVACK